MILRPAVADQVDLVNGDTIHGKVRSFSDGALRFESPVFGTVSIPRDRIRRIVTDDPVWVTFTDRPRLHGVLLAAGASLMAVDQGDDFISLPFPMSQVEAIADGTLALKDVGVPWRTSGGINLGASAAQGNVENERLQGDANLVLRHGDTRYTLRGEAKYQKERNRETQNAARLTAKHDHFFSDRWFFYTTGGIEYDKARSLDQRLDVGTGAGYQVFESERISLSFEGGISYVMERYRIDPNRSYPAARWSTDFRYDPWLTKIRFFHFNEVLSDLSGDDGMTVRTRTGMRYFLIDGLNATAQVNFDWKSDTPAGTRESDIVYMVTLGYAW